MPRHTGSGRARRARLLLTLVSLAASLLVPAGSARAQLTLPADFVDDLILGGITGQPVGMAFLPDGRLLFVERTRERIRLIVNGSIALVDPVIVVPNVNSAGGEQGLLGIAVDPGWPARPYLYIHYDYALSATIRISRYTVGGDLTMTGDGSLTIGPSTRYDILTDIPDNNSGHNGGTLRFGPDGMLYASIGDDGSACQGQNLSVLAGKILRLDVSALPAGGGGPPAKSLITPADNPYVGNANADVKLVGYWGLRNPFRFAIDPLTGALVIGDVGHDTREELNHVSVLGRNFQWPIYEGDVPGPASCVGVDSTNFTDPIFTYDHSQGLAVNGGAIYRRPSSGTDRFPTEYEGDIFYTDFHNGWVRRLKKTGSTWAPAPAPGQPNPDDWATGGTFVADWLEAPDGSLWYSRMLSGTGSGPGQLRRIRYHRFSRPAIAPAPCSPGDRASFTHAPASPAPVTGAAVEFRAPYPSPASGTISFAYTLPEPARADLVIYDAAGRGVRVIIEPEIQTAGPHAAIWDGVDQSQRTVGAGVYLAVLTVAGQRFERRFSLIR